MIVRGGQVEVWIRMNLSSILQDVMNWVGCVCGTRSALATSGLRFVAARTEGRSYKIVWIYKLAHTVLHEPYFVNWNSEIVSGIAQPLMLGGPIPAPQHWPGVGDSMRTLAQQYFLIHFTP